MVALGGGAVSYERGTPVGIRGSGCTVQRSRVSGLGFWVSGLGFRVSDFGFRVSGFGCTVQRCGP